MIFLCLFTVLLASFLSKLYVKEKYDPIYLTREQRFWFAYFRDQMGK